MDGGVCPCNRILPWLVEGKFLKIAQSCDYCRSSSQRYRNRKTGGLLGKKKGDLRKNQNSRLGQYYPRMENAELRAVTLKKRDETSYIVHFVNQIKKGKSGLASRVQRSQLGSLTPKKKTTRGRPGL